MNVCEGKRRDCVVVVEVYRWRSKCSRDGPDGDVNCAYHEKNSCLIRLAHEAGCEV